MPQRLPVVLSGDDLPLAELLAARLDGELFRVDDCFAPVDEIEQSLHRAIALRAQVPERLIAEQRSAAWIWGAIDVPPPRHELCVVAGTRTRSPGVTWMHLREVVIEPDELATIGGLQLTTPLRTIVDLARFSAEFGEAEELITARLLHDHRLTVQHCKDDMQRRRNLPNKRHALARLDRIQLE